MGSAPGLPAPREPERAGPGRAEKHGSNATPRRKNWPTAFV